MSKQCWYEAVVIDKTLVWALLLSMTSAGVDADGSDARHGKRRLIMGKYACTAEAVWIQSQMT